MPATRLRFGPFAIDERTLQVTCNGTRVRLPRQPAAALWLLASRAPDLVTFDELSAHLWPDTAVDYVQGRHTCIRQIRRALGDSAETPRYIETSARRGYRLAVPVTSDVAPPVRPIAVVPVAARALVILAVVVALSHGHVAPVPQAPRPGVEAAYDRARVLLGQETPAAYRDATVALRAVRGLAPRPAHAAGPCDDGRDSRD